LVDGLYRLLSGNSYANRYHLKIRSVSGIRDAEVHGMKLSKDIGMRNVFLFQSEWL